MMKRVSLLLPFVICILCASMVYASSRTVVEVASFTILEGRQETGEDTTYIFEDQRYVVRIALRLPDISERKMFLYSNLSGSTLVQCGEFRESKYRNYDVTDFAGREILVELEGKPPPALANKGMRMVIGEIEDFRFFRVSIEGVDTEIAWQDRNIFVLTTNEIHNAKEKIHDVKSTLSKLEYSSNADLEYVKDKISYVEELLVTAEQCIHEGAPEQASSIADTCMDILLTSVLDDQITFFNSFISDLPVDKAKFTEHLREASTQSIEAEKASNVDEYIGHMDTARDELDKADLCTREAIYNALKWQRNYLVIAAAEFVIILGLVLYLLRRKKGPTPIELFAGKEEY